jgi:uncharacterized protein (TIRG00374 family)
MAALPEDGGEEAEGSEALATAAPAKRGRGRRWLGWALALLILVSCALFVDLQELLSGLARLGPGEVALLLLIATADRALMGYKWALLLRIVGVRLPIWRVIRFFYQASFSGVFLPSHVGGDLLRAYWVMEQSGAKHPVLASLVMERLLGLISAVNWAIFGGVALAAVLYPERAWLWCGAGLLAAAGANLAFALGLSDRVHGFVLGRLGRYQGRKLVRLLHDFYAAYATFGTDRPALLLNALLTMLEQALQMALVYAIAVAIGLSVEPLAFLAATTLYMLIMRVPIAPDGWGVGELTAIGVYALIGIDATQAFSISVIGHIIPMLALTPGFIFLLHHNAEPVEGRTRRPPDARPAPADH